MRTSKEMRGAVVLKQNGKKFGKISEVVLAPKELRVIGYIVHRGDLLLMFKRKDRFLAFDGFTIVEGKLLPKKGKGVWDASAQERLGLSLDDCIVWRNMPVKSEDGRELGRVKDLAYDERTGDLMAVRLTDGALATTLVGIKDVPVKHILKCDANGVRVKDASVAIDASGGIAETSGQAAAIAGDRVSRGATKVKDTFGGMFSSFRDEFKAGLEGKDESDE